MKDSAYGVGRIATHMGDTSELIWIKREQREDIVRDLRSRCLGKLGEYPDARQGDDDSCDVGYEAEDGDSEEEADETQDAEGEV